MEVKFGTFAIAGLTDADGSVASSPSGLSLDGTRAVQSDEFIRGEHPTFRDRKNKATTISFSVTRQHESYGAAEIFCLDHNQLLEVIDDLVFRGFNNTGGPIQRIARNAALVSLRSSHMGVKSTHAYQFLVGKLEKPKITTP